MTNPYMRKGGGADIEQKATWRWRQRLELCSYEPGDQGLMAATSHGPAAPSEPLDRVNPADVLISNFRLSGQRIHFCCKPLGLWSLVVAVLWVSPTCLVQHLCCLTAPLGIFSDHGELERGAVSLFLQCLRTLHKHPSGYLPRECEWSGWI